MTRPRPPQPPKDKQNPDSACNGIEFDTPVVEDYLYGLEFMNN